MLSSTNVVMTVLCILLSNIAFSGTMGSLDNTSLYSIYAGLGGGYNAVAVNNKLYAFGVSNTYTGSTLTTYGSAGGYSNPLPSSQTTFAPEVQIGFNRFLTGRKDYWGMKASYQFLNAHAVTYNVPIAQYGAYIDAGTGLLKSSTFAGKVVAESTQVNTNHQINLFALAGHSFNNFDLYLGAGPTIFGMQSKIENAFPFANIDGESVSQSDYPVSYSKTMWIGGGVAQLGLMYHFGNFWFFDVNYTYAAAPSNTVRNPIQTIGKKPVASESSTGTLFVNSAQSIAIQTVAITVNKAFAAW